MANSFHCASTFLRPRWLNLSKPFCVLMLAKTGSITLILCPYICFPRSLSTRACIQPNTFFAPLTMKDAGIKQYDGISPVIERSGKKYPTHWQYRRPKFLLQTFVEWAGQPIRFSFWAKACFYKVANIKWPGENAHARQRNQVFRKLAKTRFKPVGICD